jgi:hypothetical protein
MVIAPGYIDRESVLATWQVVNGFDVGSGDGGVYINEKDDVGEACGYALKGLSATIESMPRHRAVEMLKWLRGKRLLRTYGELRGVRVSEEEDEQEESTSGLGVDVETSEVWSLDPRAANGFDVDACQWSWRADVVEQARARLEKHWDGGLDPPRGWEEGDAVGGTALVVEGETTASDPSWFRDNTMSGFRVAPGRLRLF